MAVSWRLIGKCLQELECLGKANAKAFALKSSSEVTLWFLLLLTGFLCWHISSVSQAHCSKWHQPWSALFEALQCRLQTRAAFGQARLCTCLGDRPRWIIEAFKKPFLHLSQTSIYSWYSCWKVREVPLTCDSSHQTSNGRCLIKLSCSFMTLPHTCLKPNCFCTDLTGRMLSRVISNPPGGGGLLEESGSRFALDIQVIVLLTTDNTRISRILCRSSSSVIATCHPGADSQHLSNHTKERVVRQWWGERIRDWRFSFQTGTELLHVALNLWREETWKRQKEVEKLSWILELFRLQENKQKRLKLYSFPQNSPFHSIVQDSAPGRNRALLGFCCLPGYLSH